MEQEEDLRPELLEWENFYVIVGSSAGALTGLQFVVMALVAETKGRSTSDLIGAFGTPTIVHFCAVLMLSAVLSAPWHTLTVPGFLLGASGAVGIGSVAATCGYCRAAADLSLTGLNSEDCR